MKAAEEEPRAQINLIVLYLAVGFLFLLLTTYLYLSLKHASGTAFVDAAVYARAIATWQGGGNPYVTPQGLLPFVYPPIFLRGATALGSVLSWHAGWYAYLAIEGVCVVAIPWLLTTVYVRSRWLTPVIAMVIFTLQPGFAEEGVLLTGNIANFVYPLALAAGIAGIRRNKWLPFLIVVGAASVLKPTFLGLLILPLLAGERQMVRCVLCVSSVLLVYLLQRILLPQSYAAFQHNVFTEIMVRGDAGFNIFNYLHRQGHTFLFLRNPIVPSLIQFAIIGAIVAGFFLMRGRRKRAVVADLWVPALLVVAILSNMRMQHIDADIAVVPSLYLCIECIRRIPVNQQKLAGLAVAFVVVEFLLVKQFEMGFLIILYGSVLLVLFLLVKETSQQDSGSSTEPGAALPGKLT